MNATAILDLKARVRERDGNRCTKCGMTREQHIKEWGTIHEVHRLEPGGTYSFDGCVTLCKRCHNEEPKRPTGTPDMATGEPVFRVSFDAESEAVRRAIYIAAAMQGKSHNELLNTLIRENLGEYLALAKKAIASGEPAPRAPRDKPPPR